MTNPMKYALTRSFTGVNRVFCLKHFHIVRMFYALSKKEVLSLVEYGLIERKNPDMSKRGEVRGFFKVKGGSHD